MPSNYEAKIEWRDINSVSPYSKNAKKHPQSQVDKLASAIEKFGFDQPVVVDGKGVIIKGHCRRESALKLGLKQIPVIVRTDLTADQIKAARLADNRLAQSDWDHDLLTAEMTDLYESDFELPLIGFDPGEIAFMFGIDLEPEQQQDAAANADDGKHKLTLEFDTRDEQQAMLTEMQGRGVKCKAQEK